MGKHRCWGLIASLVVVGAGAAAAARDSHNEGVGKLTLTTERVAVFKDGYAMVMKRATGTADAQGRVFTEQVPDAAVLGCFWAMAESGALVAMRAEYIKSEREDVRDGPAYSMVDLLRANVGRNVTITMNDEARTARDVVVTRVLEEPAQDPEPVVIDGQPPMLTSTGAVRTKRTTVGGQYVVLRAASGELAMPIAEIREIHAPELNTNRASTEKVVTTGKKLSFELGKEAAGKPVVLHLAYFTPGVRWIPTYRLSINEDNRSGRLELQGELLNELEEFKDVALDMVVGVPNFRFRGVISPLSLERTLRNALVVAAPGLMSRQSQMSNALFSQTANEWRADGGERGVAGAEMAPELGGSGEQDLFVYSRPGFDLNKGERATVPVLMQSVAFDHLYTLDIAAVRDARNSATAMYASKSPVQPYGFGPGMGPSMGEGPGSGGGASQVWHQIEIKNASAAPWTTGAVMVMAGGSNKKGAIPIAQELLKYTPAGGQSLVPLTVAVDMRAEMVEEEVSRKEDALLRNSTSYALVRAKSSITLTSGRLEPSRSRVTFSLGGKADKASDEGRITLTGHSSADWGNNDPGTVNNHSEITWEIELKPGETRTLTVEFGYYTP